MHLDTVWITPAAGLARGDALRTRRSQAARPTSDAHPLRRFLPRSTSAVALALAARLPAVAHAQAETEPPAPRAIVLDAPERAATEETRTAPRALRYHLAIDLTVIGVVGGATITAQYLQKYFAAESCRWCETDDSGRDTVNAFDRDMRGTLRWNDHGYGADKGSDVILYGLSPLTSYGLLALAAHHEGAASGFWVDALILTEALAITAGIHRIVRNTVAREAPDVHLLPEAEKAKHSDPYSNYGTFFSGHAADSFVFGAASGTIAQLRGYTWAPALWIVGMSLGATSAYLRIAADKHYATDVLTGAAVGTAVGILVPRLFHAPIDEDDAGGDEASAGTDLVALPVPVEGGGVFLLSGRW